MVCTPRLPTRSIKPIANPLDQAVEHVDGGLGVGQRTMVRGDCGAKVFGQGGKPAVADLVAEQDLAGQGRRVDHWPARERVLARVAGAAQEVVVERSIVRNDHGAVSEGKERWQHLAQ
jgi:hypothetical protein